MRLWYSSSAAHVMTSLDAALLPEEGYLQALLQWISEKKVVQFDGLVFFSAISG